MPNITLAHAKEMIRLYDANKTAILKTGYDPSILADSESFDRSDIEQLLNQQGCVSVRIYYGMPDDLKIHAILVAVNQDGDDILASTPVIIEEGHRCPPYCKVNAGLNS